VEKDRCDQDINDRLHQPYLALMDEVQNLLVCWGLSDNAESSSALVCIAVSPRSVRRATPKVLPHAKNIKTYDRLQSLCAQCALDRNSS
jgi:hypothetical protein